MAVRQGITLPLVKAELPHLLNNYTFRAGQQLENDIPDDNFRSDWDDNHGQLVGERKTRQGEMDSGRYGRGQMLLEEKDAADEDRTSHSSSDLTLKDAAIRLPPQLILWLYTHPHTVFLLEAGRGDTMTTVDEFVQRNFNTRVLQSSLKLLHLDSYKIRDIDDIKLPYAVLYVPQFKYNVIIEPNEGEQFHIDVNLTDSVDDLKHRILQSRGYPLNQQDLHLNGNIMENHVRLFEYDLHNRGKVKLHVQPGISFVVHVKTLWGKTYNIHVTATTTVVDTLCLVLQRMHSAHHQTSYSYKSQRNLVKSHELKRWLILEHNGKKLEFTDLLHLHSITMGSTITMRAFTDKYSAEDRQTIRVFRPNGEIFEVKCTKYDMWLMVALKVHSVTGIPLDALRLYHFGTSLVTNHPIGTFQASKPEVDLVDVRPKWQQNEENWQQLAVQLPSGLVETTYCQLHDNISTLKTYLERRGVANGIHYDLYSETSRLLNNMVISQIKLNPNKPLIMVLQTFPIKVLGVSGSTKVTVQGHTDLSTLLIHTSFPSHSDQSRVIFLGEELTQREVTLSQTTVSVDSVLFTIPKNNVPYIKIISNAERRTFPFNSQPNLLRIQQAMDQITKVDNSTRKSLVKFLTWRFSNPETNKYMISTYPRWLLKDNNFNVFIPELKEKPPIEMMDMDFDTAVPPPSMKPYKFYEAKPFNIKEWQKQRKKKLAQMRPVSVRPLEIDPKASIIRQRPTIQTYINNLPMFNTGRDLDDFNEWDSPSMSMKSYLTSHLSPLRSVSRTPLDSSSKQPSAKSRKDDSESSKEDTRSRKDQTTTEDEFHSPIENLRPRPERLTVQNDHAAFRNSRCVEIYPHPDDVVIKDESKQVKSIRGVTFADNAVKPFGRYRQRSESPKKWADLDKEIFARDKVWEYDDPVWQRNKQN